MNDMMHYPRNRADWDKAEPILIHAEQRYTTALTPRRLFTILQKRPKVAFARLQGQLSVLNSRLM